MWEEEGHERMIRDVCCGCVGEENQASTRVVSEAASDCTYPLTRCEYVRMVVSWRSEFHEANIHNRLEV